MTLSSNRVIIRATISRENLQPNVGSKQLGGVIHISHSQISIFTSHFAISHATSEVEISNVQQDPAVQHSQICFIYGTGEGLNMRAEKPAHTHSLNKTTRSPFLAQGNL
jgi:hypothetical protein